MLPIKLALSTVSTDSTSSTFSNRHENVLGIYTPFFLIRITKTWAWINLDFKLKLGKFETGHKNEMTWNILNFLSRYWINSSMYVCNIYWQIPNTMLKTVKSYICTYNKGNCPIGQVNHGYITSTFSTANRCFIDSLSPVPQSPT